MSLMVAASENENARHGRHLLGIEALDPSDITAILDRAETHFPAVVAAGGAGAARTTDRPLAGRTVVNLFFEASTRTRSSFEIAAQRLGADVVNVSAATSSVTKGETLLDTVKNLEAMGSDVFVIRHGASGAPHFVADRTRAHVVNAGDGAHEHPTQALLDAFVLRRRSPDRSLAGRTVAICGDILHSRVARSNALLLGKMGANVVLCAPQTLLPRNAETLGAKVTIAENFAAALEAADAVMLLRIQHERLSGVSRLPSNAEYARTFGLSVNWSERLRPGVVVLHPGPINRGVELASAVADGARSVILEQVTAGVAVRMAVLERVIAAGSAVGSAAGGARDGATG